MYNYLMLVGFLERIEEDGSFWLVLEDFGRPGKRVQDKIKMNATEELIKVLEENAQIGDKIMVKGRIMCNEYTCKNIILMAERFEFMKKYPGTLTLN